MKTIITFVLSIALLIPLSGQQKKTIDVGGSFNELSLGISAIVYLKQGSSDEVLIKCDDDVLNKIQFELKGERLVIKRKPNISRNSRWRKSSVLIYVTMSDIKRLSMNGSGYIKNEDGLDIGDIKLSVSGSGKILLNMDADEVNANISGSGSIDLLGSAKSLGVKISGSGRVKAEEMTIASVTASISGSGSCYVTVTDAVEANISGSGSVYYAGDPKRVTGNSSGSGKLKKL